MSRSVLSPPSRATSFLFVLGWLRFALRCLSITNLLLIVIAASASAEAAAVSFSGPTNYPTGAYPASVAVSDFDGVSGPDLATANLGPHDVSILLGNGSGAFTGPTNFEAGANPNAIAAGDFDGVSGPDLAVANLNIGQVSILLGNGSGGFTGPTSFAVGGNPFAVAVGDFDGDSRPDLAVANGNVSVLLGNGSGGFTGPASFAVGSQPLSVAVGDFNGDSRADLVAANFSSSDVSILLGDGSGGFTGPTNFAVGNSPRSVAVGDFNGDSRPDLAVAKQPYPSGDVSILLGDGSGGFTGPTNFAAHTYPDSVAVGDFNGDSGPDLAVANASSNDVSILLGNGFGGFTGPTNFAVGSYPYQVAVGDFNGDSRPDLAVPNNASHNVSVLLNTTASYARPKGATPLRASLVIAYAACTASSPPNRTHGPPFDDDSCSPPVQSSSNLTVGTPDADGASANSVGSLRLDARLGDPSTPADEADVKIGVSITDVRCQSGVLTCGHANTPGGADYTGEVQASAELRVTDKYNGVAAAGGGTDAATGTNTTFRVTVPCGASPTPGTVGSTCEITTTADAVYGDSSTVKEGVRAIWELGQVAVYDGGRDGLVSTPDNSLFEVQGVFVP
jgi:hypothetical protein